MDSFRIEIKRSAEHDLRALPLPQIQRILKNIAQLKENPRQTPEERIQESIALSTPIAPFQQASSLPPSPLHLT